MFGCSTQSRSRPTLTSSRSAYVRTHAYLTAPAVPAPVKLSASDPRICADSVGKAKQSLQMMGTMFMMLHYTHYLGLLLLALACPLTVESVRRKLVRRRVFVMFDAPVLTHKHLLFLERCCALGTSLVVGVPTSARDAAETVRALQLLRSVQEVVPGLPAAVDAAFLAAHDIDIVATGLLPREHTVAAGALPSEGALVHVEMDDAAVPVELPVPAVLRPASAVKAAA